MSRTPSAIQMIPIADIHILNPRVRNKKVFHDITHNIGQVGLKRPITVTPKTSGADGKKYDLVCGQGRLEAFLACKQTHIPAMVIEADQEQALIMSLVENLARRQHRVSDLLQGITLLQQQGYIAREIGEKIGMSTDYVQTVMNLIDKGEERLLAAVEAGTMPVSVAMVIANSPGQEQQALQDAYEKKLLRGPRLLMAQRLIETRRTCGKSTVHRRPNQSARAKLSANDVVKAYQTEVDRKRILIRKAELAHNRLTFVVQALRRLLREDSFISLLQAEGLDTLPQPLAKLIPMKA